MFAQLAAEAGLEAAVKVTAGTMTAEEAGDQWVAYADLDHAAGAAYLRAYDTAGAMR